jgi:flavin reductase (DIM6/NTAB) family NADH-FMN oxidoreductase RutF
MFFEPDKNDHGLPYNPIKACVVPRPIGWITTVNNDGLVNAAPFSFFNILSYNPPFVIFSAGGHADDQEDKDTVANVKANGEFVYNMATWDQRDQMNETGLIVDRNVGELSETGLEALPSTIVKPPRIKGSPVHLECKLHEIVVLPGNSRMAVHHAVFGQVVGAHIIDDAITDDGIFDVGSLKPLSRLGYKDYAWTDHSVMFQMEKRMPEELVGKPPQAAE